MCEENSCTVCNDKGCTKVECDGNKCTCDGKECPDVKCKDGTCVVCNGDSCVKCKNGTCTECKDRTCNDEPAPDPNPFTNGSVTIVYTEGGNSVSLENALPIEDKVGKKLTANGEYMDFTVSVNVKRTSNVSYVVTAEKDPSSNIDDKYVKLYLERSNDTSYNEEIMEPKLYDGIKSANSYGAPAGSMILDTVSTNKTLTYHYRLRMWLDKNYKVDSTNKKFIVRVNVYGIAS